MTTDKSKTITNSIKSIQLRKIKIISSNRRLDKKWLL